jgi:hypothetical protein
LTKFEWQIHPSNGPTVKTDWENVFKGKCGAFPYKVSGPILNDSRTVEMEGAAPRIDQNTWQIIGSVDDRLIFNYREQSPVELPSDGKIDTHAPIGGADVPVSQFPSGQDMKSVFEQCRGSKDLNIKASSCSLVIQNSTSKSQVERAYNSRGLANMALKNFSNAVQDFSHAIEHDKENAGYVDNRPSAFFALGSARSCIRGCE